MNSDAAAGGRQPALFVGHGSPVNAIEDNVWSRAFRALAAGLPRPRAVLAVSAHWFVPGSYLTANEHPETIHDFFGFPPALYDVRYPAPGDPELARRAVALLGAERAAPRSNWGLDHGTWSVLRHLLPAADCPVVQLSIHAGLPPEAHLELGRVLAPLREEGVLLLGSGNIVHNLRHALGSRARSESGTPAWAAAFDANVAGAAAQRDGAFLARALDSEAGRISHPSPDHYLPLLYVAGATHPDDAVSFPITGFDFTSLSMRAIRFG
ncbi:MAG TPA: 4,5-DOPA dioxygenase extradiol [Candidatus Saccharimonadales bacterium]|nr:4,5-DOPA dioxygenase extradiol [Candidatus Saccharimonadales bacterium]